MLQRGKIGKGTYGSVYTGFIPDSGKVAVKRNIIEKEIAFTGSIRELDILIKLRGHPHIINLLDISYGNPFTNGAMSPVRERGCRDDDVHFIFEHADVDFIEVAYHSNLPYNIKKNYIVQILLGIEYIHGKGLIHRDIKLANILLKDGSVRICDFGLSKPFNSHGPQTPKTMTSWYRAPEVILDCDYGPKCDCWSLGIILYEIITGKPLITTNDDVQRILLEKVLSFVPEIPDAEIFNKMFKRTPPPTTIDRINIIDTIPNIPDREQFIDLLEKLLKFDPDVRITVSQALDHPYLNDCQQYIAEIRNKWPPIPNPPAIVSIHSCPEREWVFSIVMYLFEHRKEYYWYRHRTIFQAIDIFDRYLDYMMKMGINGEQGEDRGQFHSRYGTELRFLAILYFAIKYFSTLDPAVQYDKLVQETFSTPESISFVSQFERLIISDILAYNIYRDTIYDITNPPLSDEQVSYLLYYYANSPTISGTVYDIYQKIVRV